MSTFDIFLRQLSFTIIYRW